MLKRQIAILGGGFSGVVLAVQLAKQLQCPCKILLIDSNINFNKGIAYNPYSLKHILNVPAGKMSAFPEDSQHFVTWLINNYNEYKGISQDLLVNAYVPRYIYGRYLQSLWQECIGQAASKNSSLHVIDAKVTDMDVRASSVGLVLSTGECIDADYCVLATGNTLPRNIPIKNTAYYNSSSYFQNPWDVRAVEQLVNDKPVLIIGNGLTMVDTVFGLLEHGFTNTIYALSIKGFSVLPHRYGGMAYTKLTEEFYPNITLRELVRLVNKHVKLVRTMGLSAESVIDSLRPYSQQLWKGFSLEEKRIFLSRLRHLWGVARHRVPLHIHDKLQQLKIEGRLQVKAATIVDIEQRGDEVLVSYYDKKRNTQEQLTVSRVINCTGPETDIERLDKHILTACLKKGIVVPDELKLGIKADTTTFRVQDARGKLHHHLFAIGTLLKGELWETTAVPELRVQAATIAAQLVSLVSGKI